MASIRQFLADLEYRLGPSVNDQMLQERLTEAENHLLDRALEFEEIGLPREEAEARAVADFGPTDEFAQNLPPRFVPPTLPKVESTPVATSVEAPIRKDIALQLAWSAVALGLVAAIFNSFGALVGGGFAAAFIGLGGLFGRPTHLRHLALLSLAGTVFLYPILHSVYEPIDRGWDRLETIGIKHRREMSSMERDHDLSRDSLDEFESLAARVEAGDYPRAEGTRHFIVPSTMGGMPYHYSQTLFTVPSLQEAQDAWKNNEETVRRQLQRRLNETISVSDSATPGELRSRFMMFAGMGGVVLMALMAGAQAVGMVIRALFLGLGRVIRRAAQPRPAQSNWDPYRR